MEKKYPEPTVGALVFNPEGEILLIKSHKWKGKYVVPGGHIEIGEKVEEALKREIKEETGLEIFDIKFICFQEFIFDEFFYKKKHFIFFNFVCKTKMTNVTLNSEAEEFIWLNPEEALKIDIEPYTKITILEYIRKYKNRG